MRKHPNNYDADIDSVDWCDRCRYRDVPKSEEPCGYCMLGAFSTPSEFVPPDRPDCQVRWTPDCAHCLDLPKCGGTF